MTGISREAMEPGRELDGLIAEKVMGWEWARSPMDEEKHVAILVPPGPKADWQRLAGHEQRYTSFRNVPRYSTDIAAAWQVVEKMRSHPNQRFCNLKMVAWCYGRTYATFDSEQFADDQWTEANGEHATPHAICLAAVSALAAPTGDTR